VLRARDRKPYKGAWNPARVLERDPAGGRVRVRYHLRPDLEEEWVPMDRRSVRPAPEVAGGVLPAEDGGDADDGSDDPARPETPVPVTAARCAESHSWMMGWDMTCRHTGDEDRGPARRLRGAPPRSGGGPVTGPAAPPCRIARGWAWTRVGPRRPCGVSPRLCACCPWGGARPRLIRSDSMPLPAPFGVTVGHIRSRQATFQRRCGAACAAGK
jgi:hypothetical protein